ncbi:conserved hypothetical protein [Burkholderia diffusa]|uniref:conjugal transfer protein TraO n=1 Tax=Burkholderia diffusa TaxID=488732 RepID=UPI001CABC425|nr:conjugal transfer protein TraO [Burkholderia diffusa]CAG9260888.1 conserved hypothetical protein [Burkholderia diffusa]
MSVQADVGRQGKIIIGLIVALVIAGGYIGYTWIAGASEKQSQISPLQTQGRGTPTKESDQYRQTLNRYNTQNAQDAQQSGQSYVSTLSAQESAVQPVAATQQQQAAPQGQAGGDQPQQPNPQQVQQQQTEFNDQTKSLLAAWTASTHSTARVANDVADYAKSIERESTTPNQQQALAAAAIAAGKVKVVEDFALVAATLETDIDTDENSLVRASVPSGKYAGATMFAMGYKRLTNTVDMTFTYMLWQGHSYKITAKAMDQNTMRSALSGEVNNRYFSRIILPAVATGIGRAGSLFAQAASQNIISSQGSVIQTYPSTPNPTAVGGTIAGGIAAQAGDVLANDAANLPVKQVLVAKGTTIGVQFIGPVLESDDVAAGATGPTQPIQQQGTNPLAVLSQPSVQPSRQYPLQMQTPQVTGFGTAAYAPANYSQSLGTVDTANIAH